MSEYLANALNDMFYNDGYRGFPVDVEAMDNGFAVTAEMPGVKKEDIQLSFEDGVLTIEAVKKHDKSGKYLIHERSFMKMKRELEFGDIHEESLSAKLDNGILTVIIKTAEPKPKKMISIE